MVKYIWAYHIVMYDFIFIGTLNAASFFVSHIFFIPIRSAGIRDCFCFCGIQIFVVRGLHLIWFLSSDSRDLLQVFWCQVLLGVFCLFASLVGDDKKLKPLLKDFFCPILAGSLNPARPIPVRIYPVPNITYPNFT